MAQYQAFESGIETNAIAPFLESGFIGKAQRLEILKKNGISELKEDSFYDMQLLLNAFKDLEKAIGEMNLFLIGKSVTEKASFPPMKDLKHALESIDVAYHMNHRKNGQTMFNPNTGQMQEGIGHYKLVRYDESAKEAMMVCHTPYPSKFEEGLILQVARTFRPSDAVQIRVALDTTKETRRNGGETCTFNIKW